MYIKSKQTDKMAEEAKNTQEPAKNDILAQVAEKIRGAASVLVALKKDPNIDELAAAIGLTQIIDKMEKHGTAIFSGQLPAGLSFLKPEEVFEENANSLQDFIISLAKEKADHLRYKVEGDFVKIFITPYRTSLSDKDLEFSHGDFNVDLVIAMNVAEPSELDAALSEYGRILHNAAVVNITTGAPGKFAEIEWSNPAASSLSEMVVQLVGALGETSQLVGKDEATALLTGIIAATERYSNERVGDETFEASAVLKKAGADQQEVVSNISAPEPEPAPAPAPAPEPVAEVLNVEQAAPAEAAPVAEGAAPAPAPDGAVMDDAAARAAAAAAVVAAAGVLADEPKDPTAMSVRHSDGAQPAEAMQFDIANIKPFAETVVDENAPAAPTRKKGPSEEEKAAAASDAVANAIMDPNAAVPAPAPEAAPAEAPAPEQAPAEAPAPEAAAVEQPAEPSVADAVSEIDNSEQQLDDMMNTKAPEGVDFSSQMAQELAAPLHQEEPAQNFEQLPEPQYEVPQAPMTDEQMAMGQLPPQFPTVADPNSVIVPEAPGGGMAEGAGVREGDNDSFVIDKPKTVLQPPAVPSGGFGLPPVASLNDAVSAADMTSMNGMPPMAPVQMDNNGVLPPPPPPPPPMPDVSAFQIPGM